MSVESPEVIKLEYPHIGDVLLQAIMETLTKTIGRKVVLGNIQPQHAGTGAIVLY